MVLVHGLAVSHRYLTALAVALAPTHPVYVPDLPGFGLSEHPRGAYDVSAHAEHLAAWLTAYQLPPVCLLGHSFGAEVAAALAANHPDAVRALVLAGPTSDPSARSRRALIGRWLVDNVREAPLQAPVLTGERDPIAPARWRDQVARLVPDADLVVVPGAAHNVVTTAATQVADACRRLLAPHPALLDR